ncbi:MAG: 3-hydroxyacyl-CoA dehydrogenase NAD-binding domain-containing protein [Proteobacteria bacterium]|nr:3-hydroxyacyl-CoA dehydrogenase NAD-binding domain-containing protein [Pseudomonadota bacterium]
MTFNKIAVLGAGLMGHGIAQVFAAGGKSVAIYDPDGEVLAAAPARIREIFELLELDASGVDRVELHGDLGEAVGDADIVFEAVPENLNLKRKIFADLMALTKPEAILASNTSGLPIGDIGAELEDASRLIGTHFWNPPHLVPLVEVIQAERTNPAIVEPTIELLRSVGKTAVHAKKDVPGFIGNRMQHALKREAIALVENGICDAETVDLVVKEGFGMRLSVMGPLENSDLVGVDLTLAIHETLLADLDRSTAPQKLLRETVDAGHLGMNVGKGFRDWTPEQADAARKRMRDHLVNYARARLKSS